MKHKIEFIEGCVVTGCTIDNIDIDCVDSDVKKLIAHNMIDTMDKFDINSFISDYCCEYGEPKFEGHCDECGDNIIKYTVEIDY